MHAKRILSLALVFFMAFALLPAPADAADNAVHPAVDLSDESGISSNNLETIGRQRTEKDLAASDASTYYATDVQIPEGITNFALCDLLAPVCRDAISRNCGSFAVRVASERINEVCDLIFAPVRGDYECHLFDLYMQEYPETALKYGGLREEYRYQNGYLVIPFDYLEASPAKNVALWSGSSHVGDYTTIAAALKAAADAGKKKITLKITNDRYFCFPRTATTSKFSSISIESADGEITTAVTFGDFVLGCDLNLKTFCFIPLVKTNIDLGSKTISVERKVFLGEINLAPGSNQDTGSNKRFSITGGAGSRILLKENASCEMIGNLNIDTIEFRGGYTFLFRGTGTVGNIDTLKNDADTNANLGPGINTVADSVTVNICKVWLTAETSNLCFTMPICRAKVKIDTIDFAEGSNLGFLHSELGEAENWAQATIIPDEITILSDKLPRGNFFQFSFLIEGTSASDANAVHEFIPKGTKLMKVPNMDPNNFEISVNAKVVDDNWKDITYKKFSYEVRMDKDGYATRGDEMTREWIGDFWVVLNRDSTYSILDVRPELTGDLELPERINGIVVTGTGSEWTFDRPFLLNTSNPRIGSRLENGTLTFPETCKTLRNVDFCHLASAIFLGPKPKTDDETNWYSERCVIYYTPEYAGSWAPNGETTWKGMPIAQLNDPKIKTQPNSVTVAPGETACFKVSATGTNLKYQWYYRVPGGDWTAVKRNGTSATYKLSAKARHDGY